MSTFGNITGGIAKSFLNTTPLGSKVAQIGGIIGKLSAAGEAQQQKEIAARQQRQADFYSGRLKTLQSMGKYDPQKAMDERRQEEINATAKYPNTTLSTYTEPTRMQQAQFRFDELERQREARQKKITDAISAPFRYADALFTEAEKGIGRGIVEVAEFSDAKIMKPMRERVFEMIHGEAPTKDNSYYKARETNRREFVETVQTATQADPELGFMGEAVNIMGEWLAPSIGAGKVVAKIPKLLSTAKGVIPEIRNVFATSAISDPAYVAVRRAGEENKESFIQEAAGEMTASLAGGALFILAPTAIQKGLEKILLKKGLAPETAEKIAKESYQAMNPLRKEMNSFFGEKRLAFNADDFRNSLFGKQLEKKRLGGKIETFETLALPEATAGKDFIMSQLFDNTVPKKVRIANAKKLLKEDIKRIKADEKAVIQKEKMTAKEKIEAQRAAKKQALVDEQNKRRLDKGSEILMNEKTTPLYKKTKLKELGLTTDITPIERVYAYKELAKKNLRSSGAIAETIKNLKENGVSDSVIYDIRIKGEKLEDLEIIKREKNGVISAAWRKDEVAEMIDNYRTTLSSKDVADIESGYTRETGFVSGLKTALRGFREPQLFFNRIGFKNVYDMVRGGEGRIGGRRAEGARLIAIHDEVLKPFSKLTKTEAANIFRAVAIRQGYIKGDVKLSEVEQNALDIFDNFVKQNQKEFFEVAKNNGVDLNPVDGFFPMRTVDDYKKSAEEGFDSAMRNYSGFASLKSRVDKKGLDIFEWDVRKVVSQYTHDFAEFVEMGKVLPKVKALIESDKITKGMTDRDKTTLREWYKDITSPKIGSSTEQVASSIFGSLKKGVSRSAITSLSTALKQVINNVQAFVGEGALPNPKYNEIVENLPSLFERSGGDFVIKDMGNKYDRIIFTPVRFMDNISAKSTLGGLLDKELKRKGVSEFADISKEEADLILNRIQDKMDLMYGGVTTEQLPPWFRSTVGKHVFAFMRPLNSILNYATTKGMTRGAAVLATGAYIEIAISNLSFTNGWKDPEDVAKDMSLGFMSNFPVLNTLIYAFTSGNAISPAATSGLSKTIKEGAKLVGGEGSYQDFGFATAEAFGLPNLIRKTAEGYQFVSDGGRRDKDGKLTVPQLGAMEAIRAFYRGQYAPLAVQEYLNNMSAKKEDRKWIFPEVEFLQNGDMKRKAQIYAELGKDAKPLYDELSKNQKKELDGWILANENKDVVDKATLLKVWNDNGIEGKPTAAQVESHMKKVRYLTGKLNTVEQIKESKQWKESTDKQKAEFLLKALEGGILTEEQALKVLK
jgi:hypothetical protein